MREIVKWIIQIKAEVKNPVHSRNIHLWHSSSNAILNHKNRHSLFRTQQLLKTT